MSRFSFPPLPRDFAEHRSSFEGALDFLQARFAGFRTEAQQVRVEFQKSLQQGLPAQEFESTGNIREGDWSVSLPDAAPASVRDPAAAPTPAIIDLEDGFIPVWDATFSEIARAVDEGAWLRVRGLMADEPQVEWQGRPTFAAWFDLCVLFEYQRSHRRDRAPRIVIPKIEGYREARVWHEALLALEDRHGFARGSTEVAVELDTVLAALQLHEVIFELKERIRWIAFDDLDYAWNWVKRFSFSNDFLLDDLTQADRRRQWVSSVASALDEIARKRGVPLRGIPALSEPGPLGASAGPVALKATPFPLLPKLSYPKPMDPERVKALLYEALLYGAEWLKGKVVLSLSYFELLRSLLWQWTRFQLPLSDGSRLNPELYLRLKDELLAQEPGLARSSEVLDLFVLNSQILEFSFPLLWADRLPAVEKNDALGVAIRSKLA